MTDSSSQPQPVEALLAAAGLALEPDELEIVARVYQRFGEQRARLAGAAGPETEPLTIAAFDRLAGEEVRDEPR